MPHFFTGLDQQTLNKMDSRRLLSDVWANRKVFSEFSNNIDRECANGQHQPRKRRFDKQNSLNSSRESAGSVNAIR